MFEFLIKVKNRIQKSLLFQKLKNRYSLVIAFFVFWLLFLDTNNFMYQVKLFRANKELEKSIDYYAVELQKIDSMLKKLDNKEALEKIAREKYYMKRKNEDIFIVTE